MALLPALIKAIRRVQISGIRDSIPTPTGRENRRLRTALANISQGLCLHDAAGRLEIFNRQSCQIYGLNECAVRVGMTVAQLLRLRIEAGNHPGRTLADLADETRIMVESRESGVRLQELGDGRCIAILHRPIDAGGWLESYEDITDQRAIDTRVLHMARHDALTELPNRFLLNDALDQAIAAAERGICSALLLLDLDRFKAVNDTLGHPVGDDLLRQVAVRLLGCVSSRDTVARLGGDEFAVLQPGISAAADSDDLACRIIAAIDAPFQVGGSDVSVGVSVGLAHIPQDGNTASLLFKHADLALYQAKTAGRGTARAYAQPGVDPGCNDVRGFEALRWRRTGRGLVEARVSGG